MPRTLFGQLRDSAAKFLRDQRGNALMLTGAAVLPVIGIVGSSVDIGRGYMTQLRLQQACDAGVLAGRRAMAGGDYSADAIAEANKMFAYNFPSDIYGSRAVNFSSRAEGRVDVVGTATAQLPTALMHIFNFDEFNLSASCAAKLEVSNTDLMLVLDVTGSMRTTNSGDSVNRITALRDAAMVFFDTLTTAEVGDGRLRFGIVPYSSSVNVGAILRDKNPNWLSDHMLVPSRSAKIRYNWGSGNPPSTVTNGATEDGAWDDLLVASVASSSACSALTLPADSTPVPAPTEALDANRTSYIVDRNGTRRLATGAGDRHARYNYRYHWSGGQCDLQRRVQTFVHQASPAPDSTQFYHYYRYEDRVFDVSQAKLAGGTLTADTGDAGAERTYDWAGCIMERRTTPFGSSSGAPTEAFDMNVDLIPTDDEQSKWQILIPEVAFPRAAPIHYKPSTTGVLDVAATDVTSENNTLGNWQNFSRYQPNGYAVCPPKATKLTTLTADERAIFKGHIDALHPDGGTYHDIGMLWGVRLLSPDGLFADENTDAANKRPISRHLIFMTDGEMSPNMENLTFQGYEFVMRRVSGSINTDKAQLTALHNNRFVQLCEAAKAKNITVWVIGFGTSLNDQLNSCATPGKAYQAASAAKLRDIFQSIAGQISRLRLSQ